MALIGKGMASELFAAMLLRAARNVKTRRLLKELMSFPQYDDMTLNEKIKRLDMFFLYFDFLYDIVQSLLLDCRITAKIRTDSGTF